MPDSFIAEVSDRYIELYENITGESFKKADVTDVSGRIKSNIEKFLANIWDTWDTLLTLGPCNFTVYEADCGKWLYG